MKNLTQWILALVALASVASLSGAWTRQERQKGEKPEVERVYESKRPRKMTRSLKQAAILRALPTFKVTLIEAIQLAEKEVGGKAISADIDLPDGKAEIQVNLFVGDKYTATKVDPTTKKVTVIHKSGVGADEGEGEGQGEGEGEKEGEEGG